MTHNAMEASSRLHCAATYTAEKATALAAMLNEDEKEEGGDFLYCAEIKGEFGKVAAFAEGEFVGYF